MRGRSILFAMAMAGLSPALSSCSGRDQRAATAASDAQAALDQGRIFEARQQIQTALGLRDDIGDYWILLAHVDLAANDFAGAFDAYQNALLLDKSNVEALTRVCQLALAGNVADKAEKYADQLALMTGDDALATAVKASAALQRGDKDKAAALIDQLLAKHPNDIQAILLRAKLFMAQGRDNDAARTLEDSLKQPGDPSTRLAVLRVLYMKNGDRPNYERTIARLAQTRANDIDAKTDYADLLFETGRRDEAQAIIAQLMTAHPDSIKLAATIVDIWLRQGANALPADRIVGAAANASAEMKAAYAQFANEIGRPDIAIAVLGNDQPGTEPNQANSDTKAAFAYAQGLRGDVPGALAKLDLILTADPSQPRALLARARLRGTAGDRNGAIEDARRLLGQDGSDPVARITLADQLVGKGEPELAESTLREGLDDHPGDPRVPARLAKLLVARGHRADAVAMLADYARAAPISLRAKRLRDSFG